MLPVLRYLSNSNMLLQRGLITPDLQRQLSFPHSAPHSLRRTLFFSKASSSVHRGHIARRIFGQPSLSDVAQGDKPSFRQTTSMAFPSGYSSSSPQSFGRSPPQKRSLADGLSQMRDIPQFSGVAYGNQQVGSPAKRSHSVPAGLFQFGFGKPSLPDICQAGDPILHEPAAEVKPEEIGSPAVEKVINDMVAVMRKAPGVGLAAPQIGVSLQIMVLEDTRELMVQCDQKEVREQDRRPFDLLVLINPKLKFIGTASARFFEGCLSVEGYRASVERHLTVEVTALGRDGQALSFQASGWQARILQHEFDHLQGVLYVDRMTPRTFRTTGNLRMPLATGCPPIGRVA